MWRKLDTSSENEEEQRLEYPQIICQHHFMAVSISLRDFLTSLPWVFYYNAQVAGCDLLSFKCSRLDHFESPLSINCWLRCYEKYVYSGIKECVFVLFDEATTAIPRQSDWFVVVWMLKLLKRRQYTMDLLLLAALWLHLHYVIHIINKETD